MKRISIIFMVLLMAGCGSMRMHSGGSSGAGARGAGSPQDEIYRGGAGYQKSPGERLTDPYDPWFNG